MISMKSLKKQGIVVFYFESDTKKGDASLHPLFFLNHEVLTPQGLLLNISLW